MPVEIVVHWRYCAMVRNIETLNGGACCCVHTIASALRLSVLSSSFSPSRRRGTAIHHQFIRFRSFI